MPRLVVCFMHVLYAKFPNYPQCLQTFSKLSAVVEPYPIETELDWTKALCGDFPDHCVPHLLFPTPSRMDLTGQSKVDSSGYGWTGKERTLPHSPICYCWFGGFPLVVLCGNRHGQLI